MRVRLLIFVPPVTRQLDLDLPNHWMREFFLELRTIAWIIMQSQFK